MFLYIFNLFACLSIICLLFLCLAVSVSVFLSLITEIHTSLPFPIMQTPYFFPNNLLLCSCLYIHTVVVQIAIDPFDHNLNAIPVILLHKVIFFFFRKTTLVICLKGFFSPSLCLYYSITPLYQFFEY